MFAEKLIKDFGIEHSSPCTATRVEIVPDIDNHSVWADFGLGMIPVFEFIGDVYLVPTARLVGMTKMEMLAWRDQNLV